MKGFPLALCVVGVAGAFMPPPPKPWKLVIQGDADGYLAPCGCTAPMTGGIRRRASYVRGQEDPRTVVIDAGGLGGTPGRQGELKAVAAAQVAVSLNVAAIHLTERDARLGLGSVTSIANFVGKRLVSTSVAPGAMSEVSAYQVKGPFLVGGVSGSPVALKESLGVEVRAATAAARALVQAAKKAQKRVVVMFSGDEPAARALSQEVPGIDILVYHAAGEPSLKPIWVGKTQLLTLGEKGKHVLELKFDGQRYFGYVSIALGPEVPDDEAATRFYRSYLKRVDAANLLAALPRQSSAGFAGTQACASCHSKAYETWKGSKHAHGLETLEKDGHGRDPDCVSCHVVGLSFEDGFRSRQETPNLADVGCESCHGGGAAHSANPTVIHLPKVQAPQCLSCHRPEQSPKFDFELYWKKIAH